MCKVNNAVTVKVILSIWQLGELNESRSVRRIYASCIFDSSMD